MTSPPRGSDVARYVLLVLLTLRACGVVGAPGDWAELLRLDHTAGRPWAAVSGFEPELDPAMAYAIQQAILPEGSQRLGYRAAFLNPQIQQQVGVKAPAFGILTRALLIAKPPFIVRTEPRLRLTLEAGLAFRLKRRVSRTLRSTEDLLPLLDAVVPMVVASDQAFAATTIPTVLDHVAVNLGSYAVVMGQVVQPLTLPSSDLRLTLSRNGRQLVWGRGSDSPGGPLAAALWLVNATLAQRQLLLPGQLLYTGPLGRQLPAEPGRYVADFGPIGRLDFEVRVGVRLLKRPPGPIPRPASKR